METNKKLGKLFSLLQELNKEVKKHSTWNCYIYLNLFPDFSGSFSLTIYEKTNNNKKEFECYFGRDFGDSGCHREEFEEFEVLFSKLNSILNNNNHIFNEDMKVR